MAKSKTHWIASAVKHPGRCKNMGSAACPKGSPQFNLAKTFKKYHGFHTSKNKTK